MGGTEPLPAADTAIHTVKDLTLWDARFELRRLGLPELRAMVSEGEEGGWGGEGVCCETTAVRCQGQVYGG